MPFIFVESNVTISMLGNQILGQNCIISENFSERKIKGL